MSEVKVNTNTVSDQPMLDPQKINEGKENYLLVKRLFDIVVSFLALVLLFPFLLIIALIVFIECPKASPIFVQKRVGKNGKIFNFFKFRSMIPTAEQELHKLLDKNEMEGHAFKIKDDPRITKVGKFLRKTSIDELPQLLNVLIGNMSIVGPRPALPREVKNYSPYELQKFLVTPGLTCYWQTTANRNDLSFQEWVQMDIDYIEDRSLKTDWNIILSTFIAVSRMNGI